MKRICVSSEGTWHLKCFEVWQYDDYTVCTGIDQIKLGDHLTFVIKQWSCFPPCKELLFVNV